MVAPDVLTSSGGRVGRSRNRPKNVLRKSPGTGRSGGAKTAGSARLQILIDFLFKSGRFGAVWASGRPGADSGRFRTAQTEDLETTGTADRDASPERRDPIVKVDDDEHDDEHDKEDDDDAASKSKVSSKKIRSVQRSV